MIDHLIPTSVVGSYPQPEWLVDRELLATTVPRVRMPAIWRIPGEYLREAQDDATLAALSDMTRAGIDIVTDGEIRRESYSNHFVATLEGVDCDRPATIVNRRGNSVEVPRIVGPIRRTTNAWPARCRVPAAACRGHDQGDGARGRSRSRSSRRTSTTATPRRWRWRSQTSSTRSCATSRRRVQTSCNSTSRGCATTPTPPGDSACRRSTARSRACARRPRSTSASGMRQSSEPTSRAAYAFLSGLADSRVDQISLEAAQPAVDLGVLRDLAGKTIILGVIDLDQVDVETPEEVAARIRRGLQYVAPERLIAAPDCGMKYLPRERAYGKLEALARGAAIVRGEL